MPNGYNFIFNSLVSNDDDFVGMVAYTLYKRQKIEWIEDFTKKNGKAPSDQEIEDGFSNFTNLPSQITNYREQAVQLLDEFLEAALADQVEKAKQDAKDAEIVKAVSKTFWRSVGENITVGIFSSVLTFGAAGLFWVASQGPEKLVKEAMTKYLEVDQSVKKLEPPSGKEKQQ